MRGQSPWPWAVPLFSGVKPTKAVLRDHFDPLYPDFNTDYPDQLRADEFLNEFGAFVRAREAHEGPEFELPSFVLLYLPDDHTGGTRPASRASGSQRGRQRSGSRPRRRRRLAQPVLG